LEGPEGIAGSSATTSTPRLAEVIWEIEISTLSLKPTVW